MVYTASSVYNQAGRLLDMLAAIWKYRSRVSVVLIDTYSSKAFYYAMLCGMACQMLGVPYIPILRGGDLPARIRRNRGMARRLFGGAAVNVSPSTYLKTEFEKEGFAVRAISNFIPIAKYPYRNRTVVEPRLLYVRAYQMLYNPVLAIRVLKEVSAKYPESTLCMVGPDKDGSMAVVRSESEALALSDRVLINGRLAKDEWIKLSEAYDIFINTTNYDNMPVSVMEAMALGMVVVSTNVGGVPALIDHEVNGILVDPNDAAAFVSWICRLIEEPAMAARMSAAARKKALSFDWSVVGPQWRDLINSAVRKNAS